AAPSALHPLVVGAFVGQRVGCRPVLEGRPPDRVMARLARQDRLEQGALAVGQLVVGTVLECVCDAVLVPRATAVDVSPEELEGHAVDMRVDVPPDLLEGGLAGMRLAGDV